MRTIDAELVTAQEAMSGTPYIRLEFESADGETVYGYSDRVLQVEHHEEAYNDYATIILRNEDLQIESIVGYWVEIGYGYTVNGTDRYAVTPRLWVKSQQRLSKEGMLVEILELTGIWTMLSEQILALGEDANKFFNWNGGDEFEYGTGTIYDIISEILSIMPVPITLAALAQNDGIIDTLEPIVNVNAMPFENAAGVLRRLIEFTYCYLRFKSGLTAEIRFPQAEDETDMTYHSGEAYYFIEFTEAYNTSTPNRVVVIGNAGEDNLWTEKIEVEAPIGGYTGEYMEVTNIVQAADLDNETDIQNRANALLSRAVMEAHSGRLVVPHDCRIELYDRIEILDTRTG